jgi:hypothetical protein
MKFRKKPVVIEAFQFEYSVEGLNRLKEFAGNAIGSMGKHRHPGAVGEVQILTLEDGINLKVKHIAQEGDWIIKGVAGEFYPCKPDIFEQTYEYVSEIDLSTKYE